jgi:glycosyltransferase involved in cell wall biosynthesis
MDVLHLSTRDSQGGAARATYRLHRGLLDLGVDSQMIVQKKVTDDSTVHGPSGKLGAIYDITRRKLNELPVRRYPDRTTEIFSPAWLPGHRTAAVVNQGPDLVNLHWIAGGFLRPRRVKEFDVPFVWTLHDMWPFTGGCHYTAECTKYEQRCGACPLLGSDEPNDLSRSTWMRKRKAWSEVSFSIVAPSTWLAECARNSTLFSEADINVIPNGLDVDLFRPQQSNSVRTELGISSDANLVCFGADWETPRKGMDLLYDALEKLDRSTSTIEVAIFGHTSQEKVPKIDIPVTYVGFVEDDTLQRLYSDADVVVVPSRQEAFGQTASEALASGTPVVAFDATGPKDIVDHEETGYLAEPYDTTDLARGIEWVLADDNRRKQLSDKARKTAVDRFSIEAVAQQYRELYNRLL